MASITATGSGRALAAVSTRALRACGPVVIALLVGAIVLVASGKNPGTVYHLFVQEAFGNGTNIANTLAAATPLLLTGVGCAICFRAGFFNVGLEGSLYVGALTSAWVAASATTVAGPVITALSLLGGIVGGAAWMVVPALLRVLLSIDEMVTTLMLNYVAIGLTSYLVLYHYQFGSNGNGQTPPIIDQAALTPLVNGTTLTIGIFIAIAAVIGYGWLLRYTRLGYRIRTIGDSPIFAQVVGISVKRVAAVTILLGGAASGLAGSLVVLGVTGNFTIGFSTAPGLGYTGIAVAVMARNSWLGIILSAVFFGALSSGGGLVQLFGNVPIALTQILQGTLMIFASVTVVLWRIRATGKRAASSAPSVEPAGQGKAGA